jgi:hypothetical protein
MVLIKDSIFYPLVIRIICELDQKSLCKFTFIITGLKIQSRKIIIKINVTTDASAYLLNDYVLTKLISRRIFSINFNCMRTILIKNKKRGKNVHNKEN